MRTLIVLTLLGVMAGCQGLEGDDPPGHEAGRLLHSEEVMMSRSSANAVIKRQRRSSDYYERFFQRAKSPLEVKMERCENYRPCDQLSEWVGFYQAYRRYFGPV
ncbi:osteocalcin-like [Engystomops pustulosus]|uniref:osteocalcin-like n=1 Tax=Engystomops pustulosus TaxID=76066 RepID=UPI003AFB093D